VLARISCAPGRCSVVAAADAADALLWTLAYWEAGLTAILVNPAIAPFEVANIIARGQPTVWIGSDGPEIIDDAEARPAPPPRHLGPDDPALVLMTSGTTGVPKGIEQTLRLQHRYMQDEKIRYLLTLRKRPASLWQSFRRMRRRNGRTRFYHAIIDRTTQAVIGVHVTRLVPYRTASFEVILSDHAWWGRDVVTEIRKALIVILARQAGIEQMLSRVHSRNYDSVLNYGKLGYQRVGTNYPADFDEFRGEPANFLMFSLRGDALRRAVDAWEKEGYLVTG
jgi:RimJ/RimL family protein N-acetyltransferase